MQRASRYCREAKTVMTIEFVEWTGGNYLRHPNNRSITLQIDKNVASVLLKHESLVALGRHFINLLPISWGAAQIH